LTDSLHDTFLEVLASGGSPGSSFNNSQKLSNARLAQDKELFNKYVSLAVEGDRDLESFRCSLKLQAASGNFDIVKVFSSLSGHKTRITEDRL